MINIIDKNTGEIFILQYAPTDGNDLIIDIINLYNEPDDDGWFAMSATEIAFWLSALPRLERIDKLANTLAERYGWDLILSTLEYAHEQANSDLPAWLEIAERLLRELKEERQDVL